MSRLATRILAAAGLTAATVLATACGAASAGGNASSPAAAHPAATQSATHRGPTVHGRLNCTALYRRESMLINGLLLLQPHVKVTSDGRGECTFRSPAYDLQVFQMPTAGFKVDPDLLGSEPSPCPGLAGSVKVPNLSSADAGLNSDGGKCVRGGVTFAAILHGGTDAFIEPSQASQLPELLQHLAS